MGRIVLRRPCRVERIRVYRRRLFGQKELEGCNGKKKGMLIEKVQGRKGTEAQSWKAWIAVPGTRT